MTAPSTQPPRTALLLIDIQEGFNQPFWGPSRSNPLFENNAAALLTAYRALPSSQHKIIHVAHASRSKTSPLHHSSPGHAFQRFAAPLPGELVLKKEVNSAFIGTSLETDLRKHFQGRGTLYVAGLTADHCVSTTVRMAGNLGVAGDDGEVVLVKDAVAAWKKEGGEWEAEVVHAVHVESLKEFASVRSTAEVLSEWNCLA